MGILSHTFILRVALLPLADDSWLWRVMATIAWLAPEIEAGSLPAVLGLSLSIIYLFLCLYTISDRHLTVALRHIARGLRMPQDLAGMTLLAFGNGAPDFFTAIFGASQAPDMILSGAVGAALFTFTIVFGLVVLLQRPSQLPLTIESGKENVAVLAESEPGKPMRIEPMSFFRNVLICIFCSSSLLALLLVKRIMFWMPLILVIVYVANLVGATARHLICTRAEDEATSSDEAINKGDFVIVFDRFWSLSLIDRCVFTASHLFSFSQNYALRVLQMIVFIIRLPFNLLINMTVLPVRYPGPGDSAEVSVARYFLNRLTALSCPLFTLLLATSIFSNISVLRGGVSWVIISVGSLVLSLCLWKLSLWDGPPKLFVLQAAVAFGTCLGMIYMISGELISCLRALGRVIGVSPSIMGLLVLAWGNSFGDLVADTTMAKSGFLNMALFGVFAAHIQNVLFTLGVSFLIACWGMPGRVLVVDQIDVKILYGLGIVGVVLLSALLVIPIVGKFTLPRWLGVIFLTLYLVFASVSILLELNRS